MVDQHDDGSMDSETGPKIHKRELLNGGATLEKAARMGEERHAHAFYHYHSVQPDHSGEELMTKGMVKRAKTQRKHENMRDLVERTKTLYHRTFPNDHIDKVEEHFHKHVLPHIEDLLFAGHVD